MIYTVTYIFNINFRTVSTVCQFACQACLSVNLSLKWRILIYKDLDNLIYKDFAFRGFPPYSDLFLKCQYFVNLVDYFIKTRSYLSWTVSPGRSFYIMLLVGVGGKKRIVCGGRSWWEKLVSLHVSLQQPGKWFSSFQHSLFML